MPKAFNSLYWVRCQSCVSCQGSCQTLSIPFIGFHLQWILIPYSYKSAFQFPLLGSRLRLIVVAEASQQFFQFPLLGSPKKVPKGKKQLLVSFNSLYWVLRWVIYYGKHRNILSIPFIGFKILLEGRPPFDDEFLSIPFIGFYTLN